MRKWEYNVATWARESLRGKWRWSADYMKDMNFNEGLDYLGSRGWEMCASTVSTNDTLNSFEYVFKRPLD